MSSFFYLASEMFLRRTKVKTTCVLCACAIVIFILSKSVLSPSENRKETWQPLKRKEDYRKGSLHRNCKPLKNIVFVKTHKTASSTVTNILNRHGDQHDLVFALPREGKNRLDWPWTMRNSSFQRLEPGTRPNIICHHGRYNRAFLEKLMPRDTVYVTILRHPVDQYESTFNYLGLRQLLGIKNKTSPLESFLEKPKEALVNYLLTENIRVNSESLKLIRNGMSFDLGLNSTHFDKESEIAKFLRTLGNQFDLVMISEFFDESMVLLKNLLCWPLEDFTYFNLNVRYENKTRANFSKKAVDAMKRWNNADFEMYRQFRGTFLGKIAALKKRTDFVREVAELRRLNTGLRKRCLRNVTMTTTIQYGVKLKRLELNGGLAPEERKMCDKIRRNEVDYLRFLRDKQLGFFQAFLSKLRNKLAGYLRRLLRFISET